MVPIMIQTKNCRAYEIGGSIKYTHSQLMAKKVRDHNTVVKKRMLKGLIRPLPLGGLFKICLCLVFFFSLLRLLGKQFHYRLQDKLVIYTGPFTFVCKSSCRDWHIQPLTFYPSYSAIKYSLHFRSQVAKGKKSLMSRCPLLSLHYPQIGNLGSGSSI